METIFSKIVKGEMPCYKVAENEHFLAFLDINPLAKGHTLVIPKRQTDYIFDLENNILAGILPFAKNIAFAIEKSIVCKRIGITVIGLEVPHAHVHLIPINNITDMDFSKSKLKFTNEEFRDIAQSIIKNLV
ncbi:MAG: HIT family hydrolase [Bacteroidetes bacterium GWE2_29_8]|nr:MAG: HIT family hydrolase [Bacteroidetes bacterium GWE2_29_8]